jgi:hypothetical protein
MAFNYSPRIITNGLVLYLDAANTRSYPGSGTAWNDLSRSGNNGTLVNGPTFSSGNGGSIVFDGVNDYSQVTGTIITSTATFIAWIRRNGNQPDYAGIIYSRGTVVSGLDFSGSPNSRNMINYTWNDAVNTYSWSSGLTIPDLTWCMCAISISSTSAIAYLCQSSGITSATNSVSHTSTTLDDIKIGSDDFGNRFFKGNIAQALIYNRALSATEILQNYNATKTRFGL